jgi:hypothetical protein
LPPAVAPTWLLSGSLDPVTPPRHGQRVAQALGFYYLDSGALYRLTALAAQRVLFALHAAAWRQGLWRSGIEVDPDGSGRAPRLGALLNASLHSILSLARADWPMGLSPGGLSTNGYNGWAL